MPVRLLQPAAAHRAFAALGVLLVLALGLFGADAGLHARLHDADHAHGAPPPKGGDHCAVELFAGGVSLPLDLSGLVTAPARAGGVLFRVVTGIVAVTAPYRLPPGQGPPQG